MGTGGQTLLSSVVVGKGILGPGRVEIEIYHRRRHFIGTSCLRGGW